MIWNLDSIPASSGGYQAGFVVTVIQGTAPGTPIYNTASLTEATQVCRNWLAYVVHELGDWAGDTRPRIDETDQYLGQRALRRALLTVDDQDGIWAPGPERPDQPSHDQFEIAFAGDIEEGAQELNGLALFRFRKGAFFRARRKDSPCHPPDR